MSSQEYNQLLRFLYFEGYAESYEEAEELLESMSDEEFEELLEAKDVPQEVALRIANMLSKSPSESRRGRLERGLRSFAVMRNKKRIERLNRPQQTQHAEEFNPNNEDLFESVAEYLFVEGYADTIESAEIMAENISEDWTWEILDERRRSEKGTPRKPRNAAFEYVAKLMGTSRMGVQPRGKKKVPGQKPPVAGEHGSGRETPAKIVQKRREARQSGIEAMSSRFD